MNRKFVGGLLATVTVLALAPAATSATAAPHSTDRAQTFQVQATVSTHTAQVGDLVTLTGTVTPNASQAIVQQRAGKRWETVATRPVVDGKFRWRFHVTSPGDTKLRALVPAAGGVGAGMSSAVRVTGYRWRYISDMPWFKTGDWDHGAATIDGHSYPRSIWANNDFWGDLEVNVDAKCTALQGVAGLTSESDSGSSGNLSISRDGSEIYNNTFTMTTTDNLNLDVSGALRLAFHLTDLTDSTFPDVGIGNAKLYCAS